MNTEDERFEAFLRQFRPRRPRPLPNASAPHRKRWMAAAAALTLIAAGGLMLRRGEMPNGVAGDSVLNGVPAAGAARAALVAGWDDEAWDRMLTDLSPRVLPDVERRGGSLYVLARN